MNLPHPTDASFRHFRDRRRSLLLALVVALILTTLAAIPLFAARGTSGQRPTPSGATQGTTPAGQSTGAIPGTHGTGTPCPVVANPTANCFACPPVPGQPSSFPPCEPCPTVVPTQSHPCLSTPTPPGHPTPTPTAAPGSPTIFFCPGPPVPVPVGPEQVQLRGMVCGKNFHPAEVVNFLATGAGKSIAWHATADSNGNLVAQLPLLLCQLAPLTLVATGNEGSRSNTLILTTSDCRPRP